MENIIDKFESKVVILDFGSQYTQLIARRIREMNVYAEIFPYDKSAEEIKAENPSAVIFSGGPSSIYEEGAPQVDKEILNIGVPVLGICYGLYVVVDAYNGTIESSPGREYGHADINVKGKYPIFKGTSDKQSVWMSHGDKVTGLPEGFELIASSENAEMAAIQNIDKKVFGLQFHPEVHHSEEGKKILSNFLFEICNLKADWNMKSFIQAEVENIRKTVGDGTVLLGLSGGVDSSVAARIIQEAVGDRLYCVFVDNGLLRKNERELVEKRYKEQMNLNVITVDATDRFLTKLAGITDPEQKRKIIGKEFVEVFMEEASKIGSFDFLAQGTLYPDVIESVSTKGPSDTIKSHHNRVPEILKLIESGQVVEPLKELFKDEVRALGLELGMTEELIFRHPFPGPGLAIRVIGELTKERLDVLREADDIIVGEIKKAGLYRDLWQVFGIYLPVQSVGVMGDSRTYENVIALRAVESVDAMTADWADLPKDVMRKISNRIINEVRGINRVVYDISSKPPATIEWE